MNTKKIGSGIISSVIVIVVLIFVISCITTVPAGYIAVQYDIRGGIRDEVLTQGWHFVSPMIKTRLYSVSLNQSYLTASDMGDSPRNESYSACTAEGKEVVIDLTYTYQYAAEDIVGLFSRFKGQDGTEIRDSFIKPNIVSWSKEVIAKYKVTALLGSERANINSALSDYLADKFAPYGIKISNVSLINIDVDEETSRSINAKITAQQNAETQAINNQTSIDKANADAQVERTTAQAHADALLIAAEAEAKANRMLDESLSDKVLDSKKIEKWDGVLPKYMMGDNATPMIEVEP